MSPIYYDWQGMDIRRLTTLEDCKRVAALEKTVWGLSDAEDVVPPILLIVSIKRGGILLGAFDGTGEMQGFVYSMAGLKDGRPMQWSHMLGVAPTARDSGLGTRLKLAQRDVAIAMGLELIEWTFDPLQALNAHFNFAKLGVVAQEYEENAYGESSSPLHRGAPTDRFVAEWRITAAHVERRITSMNRPLVRDARVMAAPVVNPSGVLRQRLVPGVADLSCDEPRLLVEIPTDFDKTLVRDPALALEWRLSTRAIFEAYFARGYRAVDFLLSRSAGRGQYLLALPNP
jgi:predicted GNAT superfamily acetyltransferase